MDTLLLTRPALRWALAQATGAAHAASGAPCQDAMMVRLGFTALIWQAVAAYAATGLFFLAWRAVRGEKSLL